MSRVLLPVNILKKNMAMLQNCKQETCYTIRAEIYNLHMKCMPIHVINTYIIKKIIMYK